VVWDFDWSLVNENSDLYCFSATLADPAGVLERVRSQARDQCWTKTVTDAHCFVAGEHGVCAHRMVESVCAIPVFPEVLDVIRSLAGGGHDQVIVSDANTCFIEAFLKHHGLAGMFSVVETNKCQVLRLPQEGADASSAGAECSSDEECTCVGGRATFYLSVSPHDDPPSHCEHCPPRLCKGEVLAGYIKSLGERPSKVVYVGDGHGDLCPCLRLSGREDAVLARRGFALSSDLRRTTPTAQVKEWSDGAELARHLVETIEAERLAVA